MTLRAEVESVFKHVLYFNDKHIGYVIQDADGYNLETIDKSWPALNSILKGNPRTLKHNLILRFEIDLKTVKVRWGSITDITDNGKLLINFYKQNKILSPNQKLGLF